MSTGDDDDDQYVDLSDDDIIIEDDDDDLSDLYPGKYHPIEDFNRIHFSH